MPKKKTRKPGKRAATRPSGGTRKQAAGGKKRAAERKPASAKTSGSGLVYTDLLREALAGRSR